MHFTSHPFLRYRSLKLVDGNKLEKLRHSFIVHGTEEDGVPLLSPPFLALHLDVGETLGDLDFFEETLHGGLTHGQYLGELGLVVDLVRHDAAIQKSLPESLEEFDLGDAG